MLLLPPRLKVVRLHRPGTTSRLVRVYDSPAPGLPNDVAIALCLIGVLLGASLTWSRFNPRVGKDRPVTGDCCGQVFVETAPCPPWLPSGRPPDCARSVGAVGFGLSIHRSLGKSVPLGVVTRESAPVLRDVAVAYPQTGLK